MSKKIWMLAAGLLLVGLLAVACAATTRTTTCQRNRGRQGDGRRPGNGCAAAGYSARADAGTCADRWTRGHRSSQADPTPKSASSPSPRMWPKTLTS